MSDRITLEQKPWSYILYKDGKDLLLTVVCGKVGLYEVAFKLNEMEMRLYHQSGNKYIAALALKVKAQPNDFINRTNTTK